MNPETLYKQLGRLIETAPDFSGFDHLTTEHLIWIGRAHALVKASGDPVALAEFNLASKSIGEADIERRHRRVAGQAEDGVGDELLGAHFAPHALGDPADEPVAAPRGADEARGFDEEPVCVVAASSGVDVVHLSICVLFLLMPGPCLSGKFGHAMAHARFARRHTPKSIPPSPGSRYTLEPPSPACGRGKRGPGRTEQGEGMKRKSALYLSPPSPGSRYTLEPPSPACGRGKRGPERTEQGEG